MVFVLIEILFKMLLFKGGVLIYAEHCIYTVMAKNIGTLGKYDQRIIYPSVNQLIILIFY